MSDSYSPHVFDVDSIEAAKAIILTPEGGTTRERWEKETPWIGDLIVQHLGLGPDSVLLDYGCGIGRLAAEAIMRTGCWVVGVDISPSMRALGHVYVNSHRFMSVSPDMLLKLGISFDAALAVWVLQHCAEPGQDINRLRFACKPRAPLLVVNNIGRAVPTASGRWVEDGQDVWPALEKAGWVTWAAGTVPPEVAPPGVADNTRWQLYANAV